jgi:adenine-specific DNA-methyltransferase
MQHLYDELKQLLIRDERFLQNGSLLWNKVIQLALQPDAILVSLLLTNDNIKKHFFVEAAGVLVFDKIMFRQFVSDHADAAHRTVFTVNGTGSAENDEVVLWWPHKDCILESGHTREEAKRNEIFWNEIAAPGQVHRLLCPKVFTGFKQFNETGEHPVTTISKSDNLIIRGNNLQVLHSLKHIYSGEVKLIYIDPPYNTDNGAFLYNDHFKQSTWLTFMKNRLTVARELLRADGAIFVQISDVRAIHLKLLLDEIFGNNNFINQITVKTKSPSGFKTVNLGVFETAEYIFIYGKDKKQWKYKPQFIESAYDPNYRYVITNINAEPAQWNILSIEKIIAEREGFDDVTQAKKTLGRKVFTSKLADYAKNNAGSVFRFTEVNHDAGKETLEAKAISKKSLGKVIVVNRTNKETRYILNGREICFYSKKLKNIQGELMPTMPLTNIWTDIPYEGIAGEGGVQLKKGKKPEKLLHRIIGMATDEQDIVMDFFLGSGTTCAVAHKLNRIYIGIEQLDYAHNDSVVRLNHVIKGDRTGISKLVNWQGGGSFIFCELTTANRFYIEQIKKATCINELNIIAAMMNRYDLLLQHDLNAIDEPGLAFNELRLVLLDVLSNHLFYVPYSQITDEIFAFTKKEIELNNLFYRIT